MKIRLNKCRMGVVAIALSLWIGCGDQNTAENGLQNPTGPQNSLQEIAQGTQGRNLRQLVSAQFRNDSQRFITAPLDAHLLISTSPLRGGDALTETAGFGIHAVEVLVQYSDPAYATIIGHYICAIDPDTRLYTIQQISLLPS